MTAMTIMITVKSPLLLFFTGVSGDVDVADVSVCGIWKDCSGAGGGGVGAENDGMFPELGAAGA